MHQKPFNSGYSWGKSFRRNDAPGLGMPAITSSVAFRSDGEQPVYTSPEAQGDTPLRSALVTSIGVLETPLTRTSPAYLVAKRALDIVGSLFGILVLLPLFAVLALLVRRDSRGPAFHRRRVLSQQNYHGGTPHSFDAFKFRTMIVDADDYLLRNPHLMRQFQVDYKLREDPRITPFGSKLRTTSLDELPQLFNVLRGQMSLVGPRIISPPELENYGDCSAKLLAVKPGLTGLWQVSGRQDVSYPERVRLDMEYIDNRSLLLDIQILLRTIKCVVQRRGAF